MSDHSTHDEESTSAHQRDISLQDLGTTGARMLSGLGRQSRLSANPEPEQPPEDASHTGPSTRRTAFRVEVSLKTMVQWLEVGNGGRSVKALGVLTNLSGGGAQLFLRQLPAEGYLRISLAAPDDFVEERARRSSMSGRRRGGTRSLSQAFFYACDRIRDSLREVEARIVDIAPHATDDKGTVYALSLSFIDRHDNLYRLVSFLQRRKVQQHATAAKATPSWRREEAALRNADSARGPVSPVAATSV